MDDFYRFQYWGDREEHAHTVVKVPSRLSRHVVDPSDNEGKPRIIIPQCNRIEFVIIGSTTPGSD